MAEHANVAVIRKGYEAFANGDMAALTNLFAEQVVWHLPGDNQISGEHRGRNAVFAVFAKVGQISGGTFNIELHDVLANDHHAVVLQRVTGNRAGKHLDALNADVYHLKDGKIVEWWSFTNDRELEDKFWSD